MALVGQAGGCKSVANDRCSRTKCRSYQFLDMLRPAGCIQEQLGDGIDSTDLGVQHQAANAFGEEGAQKVLEILNAELRQAMAAAGVSSIAKIDRSIVKTNFP